MLQENITVQLPRENNTEYKTSVRVNDVVMKEFRDFCERNKQFTKKELLSMALKEYVDKYSNS